jgi:hypothetical protein
VGVITSYKEKNMPITPELAVQERGDIIIFIRQVLELLDSIVREPYGPTGSLIFEDMSNPLSEAWAEFREDFDIEIAMGKIERASDQSLENHGLYGAQSAGKRRLIEIRLGIFNGQRTKRTLLWLLDSIDTYLDSIINATGLSEALKEIKDLLRNSIDVIDDESTF